MASCVSLISSCMHIRTVRICLAMPRMCILSSSAYTQIYLEATILGWWLDHQHYITCDDLAIDYCGY